jgi:tRNA(adenine34) deaminase
MLLFDAENPLTAQQQDENFMREALREAHKALASNEVPIGCVVVCQNKIIGRGHNLTEMLADVTAHAEMQAVTAAAQFLGAKYLTDCVLYVTVEPCVMCAGAIAWAQVSRVVFGATDEKRGFSRFAPMALHPKTEIVSGVLEDECKLLMVDFFKKKR